MIRQLTYLWKPLLVVVTLFGSSSYLFVNCGRATLGAHDGLSGTSYSTASQVSVSASACPANQAPIGLSSSFSVLCAPITTSVTTSCPAGSSIFQIANGVASCVVNTSYDQPGAICPVGQFLFSFSANGSIACQSAYTGSPGFPGVTGGTGSLNVGNYTCPAGQYLSGVVNGQAVCVNVPATIPNAQVCATGQFLKDIGTGGLDCQARPWVSVNAQTCASGSFPIGFDANNALICQQTSFATAVGANFACPAGQVLSTYANGTGTCAPAPTIDLAHACQTGYEPTGLQSSLLLCSAIPSGVTACGPGQYVTALVNGLPVCGAITSAATATLPGACPQSTYPIGLTNGHLVCVSYDNLRYPSSAQFCFPGENALCAVQNGFGNQTCSQTGTSLSSCSANVCLPGFQLTTSGTCAAMACTPGTSQPCAITNGKGAQFCGSSGQWGSCQLASCAVGFAPLNGACAPQTCTPGNTTACSVGNAFGFQTCLSNGTGYGSCFPTSCQNGYTLVNGKCADTTAPRITFTVAPQGIQAGTKANFTFSVIDNESGVKTTTCTLDGAAYTPCTSPVALTNLANGPHSFTVTAMDNMGNVATQTVTWTQSVCAAGSTQACRVANGAGTEACLADGTFDVNCAVATCDAGYKLMNGACVALNCPAGYTVVGNACVDQTAPTILVPTAPLDPTYGTTAQVIFSANDAGSGVATVTCQLDSGAAAACTSPLNLTGLSVGLHTLTIVATDVSGNKATKTVTWHQLACSPGTVAACGILNGQGQETCSADGTAYGTCMVTACNSGFVNLNGSCQPVVCTANQSSSCSVPNGTGTHTCNATGTAQSACVATACNDGYKVVNGACVAKAEVTLGAGNGATPVYFGDGACNASCQGTYGTDAYCAGGCYQGYRDWMYCGDCRAVR